MKYIMILQSCTTKAGKIAYLMEVSRSNTSNNIMRAIQIALLSECSASQGSKCLAG
jgi:hypothetical protein